MIDVPCRHACGRTMQYYTCLQSLTPWGSTATWTYMFRGHIAIGGFMQRN